MEVTPTLSPSSLIPNLIHARHHHRLVSTRVSESRAYSSPFAVSLPPSPSLPRYKEAIALYTQGLDIDPDNHVLYSNRSAAYLKEQERGKVCTYIYIFGLAV